HATCWTRDWMMPVYTKGVQKSQVKEIQENLDAVVTFVKYIRARIDRYAGFMRSMKEYLAAQGKAHPELKDSLAALDRLCAESERRFRNREEKMKTPDYVVRLTEEFRKQGVDAEGPAALERCKAYTEAIV